MTDGTNNIVETIRRKDGVVVGTYGRPGRAAANSTGCTTASSTPRAICSPARSTPESACRNGNLSIERAEEMELRMFRTDMMQLGRAAFAAVMMLASGVPAARAGFLCRQAAHVDLRRGRRRRL